MIRKLTVSNLGTNESDYFSDNYHYNRLTQEVRVIFDIEYITPLCVCESTHEFILLIKEIYKRKDSILTDFKELNSLESMLEEIRNENGGK